jgi:hypothetical protein
MGLLDGFLGGALGQVEAAAAPALISAVLAKTNLVTCRASSTSCSRAASATRSSRGSAAERTCLFRPISFAPRSAATRSSKWRSISGFPPTPRSSCCRSIFRASSTRRAQAAHCHRPDSASSGLLRCENLSRPPGFNPPRLPRGPVSLEVLPRRLVVARSGIRCSFFKLPSHSSRVDGLLECCQARSRISTGGRG